MENPDLHYHKLGFGYALCTDAYCTQPRLKERPLGLPPWLVSGANRIFIAALVLTGLVFLNQLPGLWHNLERSQQIYGLCRQQQPSSDTFLQLLERMQECQKLAGKLVR